MKPSVDKKYEKNIQERLDAIMNILKELKECLSDENKSLMHRMSAANRVEKIYDFMSSSFLYKFSQDFQLGYLVGKGFVPEDESFTECLKKDKPYAHRMLDNLLPDFEIATEEDFNFASCEELEEQVVKFIMSECAKNSEFNAEVRKKLYKKNGLTED